MDSLTVENSCNAGDDLMSHMATQATLSASHSPSARPGILRGKSTVRRRKASRRISRVKSVGTSYGKAQAFHTTTVDFDRSTEAPTEVITVRYASMSQLKAWGVPLPGGNEPASSAFPGEQGKAACPAPAGWKG